MLVHRKIARIFLPAMIGRFKSAGVEIRGCAETARLVGGIGRASEKDWYEEYLGLILSVRVVGNVDEGYRLYRNQAELSENSHWLAFELEGAGVVNRDAVGARITLTTDNGVTQMQEVINGASLGAGNELALYFGLGPARGADIEVRWPDGTRQTFTDVKANQRYHLSYPAQGSSHEAREVMKKQEGGVLHFSLTAEQLAEGGLICGGNIDIFVEPLKEAYIPIYREVTRMKRKGGAAVLATLINGWCFPER